jgi:SLA1 homology domain 1, SHD1
MLRFCRDNWKMIHTLRQMRLCSPFVFCVVLLGMNAASAREWADAQGRKLQADFVSYDAAASKVKLKLASGQIVDVALATLSAADQGYVKDQTKGQASAPKAGSFSSTWPERVEMKDDPEVEIIKEDKEKKDFVYESKNFRFKCDAPFSKQVVRGFAQMFECTLMYVNELPLGMGEGARTDGKYQVRIFEKTEDYHAAGAPSWSAGVFMPHLKSVFTPIESLGLKKVGSGYMLDRTKTSETIIHELTHQLTPTAYFTEDEDNGWFTEGVAEYVGNTPYRSGSFNLKGNPQSQIAEAVAYGKDDKGGRALGDKFSAPHLEKFMTLTYDKFTGSNGNFNYGFSTLLVAYFVHLDGAGDGARLKAYLQALLAHKSSDEANKALLDGRSWQELEKEFSEKMKHKRVEVSFQ